jgi:hypothetical protein
MLFRKSLLVNALGTALLFTQSSWAQNTLITSSVSVPGGNGNVLIGPDNFYSTLNGNENTLVGRFSGQNLTNGSANSFFGFSAGKNSTLGVENTFVGYNAGLGNRNGSGNCFMGYLSGVENTSGTYNVMLGIIAGTSNTVGSYNTFMGYSAGSRNISGILNTYLGSQADATGINKHVLEGATAIGHHALVGVNDGLVLGDTANVKVGIGTAYPTERLTIRGNLNYVAYDNSLMLKGRPFLHFNEHESLALGLGSVIPSGAERTLVLGSKETTVQIPGIVNSSPTSSGQFLTVDGLGNVRLAQPRVQVASVADWSDKVFEPGYALRPLGEVEEFVKKNKHLPGVPSAAAMVAEGMESAAFNAKLLEKIEELTLYVVDLEKRLKEIEKN